MIWGYTKMGEHQNNAPLLANQVTDELYIVLRHSESWCRNTEKNNTIGWFIHNVAVDLQIPIIKSYSANQVGSSVAMDAFD